MKRGVLLFLLVMGFPVFAFVTAKTDPGPERLLAQWVLVIVFALVPFFSGEKGWAGVTETVAVTL